MMHEEEVVPSQVEGAPGQKPASDPAAAAPTKNGEPFLVVKRRGQEAALTRDQTVEYAQKGFDYERKMAELKEEQARLKDYAEFDSRLKADPKLREAVKRAYENPDSVLRPKARAADPDDGDDDAEVEERRVPSSKIEDLEREIAALKAGDAQRQQREAFSKTEKAIDDKLGTYEFLSTKAAGRKHVMGRALALLREDRHMPLDEAVASAVGEYQALLKESQTKELERNDRMQGHRVFRPDAGVPVAGEGERPKYTKDRIRGATHKRILDEAKSFFPKAFGG